MNTFNSVVLRLLTLSCAGLLLSACGSLSQVDDQGHSSEPRFPAVSESYRPQGSYANLENLAKIQPGMSKAQLYELIGAPHFHEGMFAVREWDYILRFRRAGQADLVCQYKVLFDKDLQAQSFLFSPANCLDQLKPAASPVVQPAPSVQQVTLSADASFAFDWADLSAAGRGNLDRLAAQIRRAQPQRIAVTGHSDRLGSRAHNLDLSRRRAEAVRDYLAALGVPAGLMQVRGVGAAEPLVSCPDAPREQLIQCLASNRRVVVELAASAAQPISSEE